MIQFPSPLKLTKSKKKKTKTKRNMSSILSFINLFLV